MTPENQRTPYEEDSIDLRSYFLALVRYWPLIVGMTLLAVVAAVVVSSRQTPTYEASAKMAIVQSRTELSLEPRFVTLSEEELKKTDVQSWRKALAGLVQNAAIAQVVISRLGDQIPPDLQDVGRLVGAVNGRIAEGDLIEISVRYTDPAAAALVANAWGEAYESYVNLVYSSDVSGTGAAIAQQAAKTKSDYDTAQQALIEFLASSRIDELNALIQEKEQLIGSLQAGKQSAITSIIEKELDAQVKIIAAYMNAQAQNVLLAFNKEQEAKRKLLSQYIDAEVESRLLAFSMDRQARVKLFNRLAQAEIDSYSAVFDQQVAERINNLVNAYAEKARIESLLDNAHALQRQIESGGDAATSTNGLALMLLKAEAFASSTPLPGELQITLDAGSGVAANAADQQADVTALVSVLETRLAEIDEDIQVQSAALLGGDDYHLLTELTASQLAVSAPLTETIAASQPVSETASSLSPAPDALADDGSLSAAIRQRYLDLFTVGGLSESSRDLAAGTPLFDSIEALYPDLFSLGALSQLTEDVQSDNPLVQSGAEKTRQLLALQGLEQLPAYSAAAEPLTQAIAQLQEEVRALRSDLEAETAKSQELTRAQNLAWETYTTVARKQAEVEVASAMTDTVVRLAVPAMVPSSPEGVGRLQLILTAAAIGLVLGIGVTTLVHFIGSERKPAVA